MRLKKRIQQVLINLPILIISLSFLYGGCVSNAPVIPIYWMQGDSARGGIYSAQDDKFVDVRDSAFDGYSCAPTEQISCLLSTYAYGCKKWRPEAYGYCDGSLSEETKQKIEKEISK